MSKFDSWVMDQQEREMEEAADRLNKEEAFDIAISVDPDTSEVVKVLETITDPLEKP